MIVVSLFSFHESYGALLLRRRARNLRQRTGNTQYYTAAERLDGNRPTIGIIGKALTRPLRLLPFHPIIQVSATLSGLNYGIMYITLSTFSNLWTSRYHESIEISGLHCIACALGELVASQIGGPLMDFYTSAKGMITHLLSLASRLCTPVFSPHGWGSFYTDGLPTISYFGLW